MADQSLDQKTESTTLNDTDLVYILQGTNDRKIQGSNLASQIGGKLVSGDNVGTTDTQTLTNKTINGPDNTITNVADASLASGATVVSAGAGDSGKLVKLDAAGHVDASAVNDADIDHTAITNIGTNSHSDIDTHIAASSVHGLIGDVVGTSDAQNITSKTISSSTIVLKQSATPAPTTEGKIEWDTDDDSIKIGDGTGTVVFSNDTTNAATYAAIANGVTNGDSHNHFGGDGAQIDHTTLSNKGTNSHSDIDTHIAATAAHGATGAVVGTTNTQTLTNKTLTAPVISTISNTGTVTLFTDTDTVVGKATTDTLTNKTLTAPVISTISNTGTITLPTDTDTLVGRATTDTLTNKTIDGDDNTVQDLPITALKSGVYQTTLTDSDTNLATSGGVFDHVAGITLNNQTGTTYTFVLTDRGKLVTLNNASAITATIPANGTTAFPVGTQIELAQLGAGQVTVAITTDTLNSSGSKTKLTGQYSTAVLTKITSTSWILAGDITT